MPPPIRVLHVDDDREFGALTAEFLERENDRFEVEVKDDPTDALDRLSDGDRSIDCVVSDYQMPDMNGIEFLRTFRARAPDAAVPFVLLTGKGSEEVAAEALNAGATSYVQKGTPDTYQYLAERILLDIRAARRRRESDRFGTVVRALDDPVYVLDREGRFTYANDAFCDLTGYEREAVLGASPALIKEERATETAERHLAKILSSDGPESIKFEVEIQTATGDSIRCEDHMGVLPYEGETFRGSVGVLREISDREERAQVLREAKDRYQLLVGRNLVGLYIVRQGRLVYHNERFAELFGYPGEANVLDDQELADLVEPADRNRLVENLQGIETGELESIRQSYAATTRDGGTVDIELLGRGIELNGTPAVLGTVVDIRTDEAEYRTLQRERNRLDEFTTLVSHDLRDPLSVARGNVEIALDADGAPTEPLGKVADALERIDELLTDLVTLAEQGETVSDRETVGVSGRATAAWRNTATGGAELTVEASGTIRGDPRRLRELFENLYRNAVEHGTTGTETAADEHTEVTVHVGDLDDGFYVEDDGAGIPAEDRKQVFEPKYTTDDDGTGLGLTIVAEVAEAHGWRVVATEGRDGGARIEVRGDECPVRRDGDEGPAGGA
jgi:PAS domain S-box-containing protein